MTREILEKAIREIHDAPGRPDLPMEVAFPAWAAFRQGLLDSGWNGEYLHVDTEKYGDWWNDELTPFHELIIVVPGVDAEDAGLPEP